MTARLRVSLVTERFERVRADVAIAGFFPNERPLRGAAGRADWRLCGIPSDLLAAGRLRERSGEALLVPGAGRLASSRILLVALGRRAGLNTARIHKATAGAIRRGLGLGARRLALAPPTGEDGVHRYAGPVLAGALEAVIEADVEVELGLVIAPEEANAVRKALEKLLAAKPVPEVELLAGTAGSGPPARGQRGRIPPSAQPAGPPRTRPPSASPR